MLISLTPQEILVRRFITYCWRAIEHKSSEAYKFLRKSAITQIPVEMYSDVVLKSVIWPKYTDTEYVLDAVKIAVHDSDLADALDQLSELRREIILLSFFLQQTDCEIASCMHFTREKVNYQKRKAIDDLKNWIVSTKCDEK